jgi:hypothetical protein
MNDDQGGYLIKPIQEHGNSGIPLNTYTFEIQDVFW